MKHSMSSLLPSPEQLGKKKCKVKIKDKCKGWKEGNLKVYIFIYILLSFKVYIFLYILYLKVWEVHYDKLQEKGSRAICVLYSHLPYVFKSEMNDLPEFQVWERLPMFPWDITCISHLNYL